MEEQLFIPDNVLIQTFSYLAVADVRSCRLVSTKWHFCCENISITRAQKFVFRSGLNLPSEINEILINLERKRVNLTLMDIDLKELNFEAFGWKISELELFYCSFDIDTLKKLFYVTPNVTRIHLISVTDSWFGLPPPDRPYSGIISKTINFLHKQKFQNPNMIEFKCNVLHEDTINKFGCRFSHFLIIFPRIKSISLWENFYFTDTPELRNILPKSNITHLGRTISMDFERMGRLETFASLSRLKILDLKINSALERPSLCLYEKLFSELTDLEELSCQLLHLQFGPELAAQSPTYICPEYFAKSILFQILQRCSRLKILSFLTMSDGTKICLNQDEFREFFSLITNIKKLQLPRIVAALDSEEQMVTLPNNIGLLKDLDFEVNFHCDPFDVRCIIMNTYQLTSLSLTMRGACFYTNFEKTLQSQKCLQRLEIVLQMETSDIEALQINSSTSIQLKHEKLNHLVYVFRSPRQEDPIDCFLERLCAWEFPNLFTLEVTSGFYQHKDCFQTSTHKLKNLFKTWIARMITLIKVKVNIHTGLLNFEDCEEVCGQMLHLQELQWTYPDIYKLHAEIVHFFKNHPNLGIFVYGNDCLDGACKYIRSRNRLLKF